VFVEQDYIRTKLEKVPDPPEPDPASGETQAEAIYRLQWRSDQETAEEDSERKRESLAINRVILSALLRNGIEVRGDFNPKIFHQKFIIRDYRGKAQPNSALLTARPTTPTTTSTTSSSSTMHASAGSTETSF
jgi:hypothetical protein